MNKKIITLILFSFTLLALYLFFYYVPDDDSPIKIEPKYIEGVSGPGTNSYSYGLYSESGELYEDEYINMNQGKNTSIFSISNFYNEKKEFMFIVLLDNIPGKFNVEGKEYKKLKFEVGKNENYQIPFDISIDNHNELAVLAFPMPSKELSDINSVLQNQNLLYLRYRISDNKVVNDYNEDTLELVDKSLENVFEPIFLSNKIEELQVPLSFENNELYIHISNVNSNSKLNYDLLFLKDYELLEVNGNKNSYVSVDSNSRNVYKIEKPNVKGSILEILAIPKSDKDNNISQLIFNSTKINLQNETEN